MEPQTQQIDDVQPKVVNGGEILVNMEGMIKNYIASIDLLKQEKRKLTDMAADIYNNDQSFREQQEAVKAASKVLKEIKAQIDKRPQMAELKAKVKEMSQEIKSQQLSLFDYATEYTKSSGVNEIETNDGQMMDIVLQAKLVKKPFRR